MATSHEPLSLDSSGMMTTTTRTTTKTLVQQQIAIIENQTNQTNIQRLGSDSLVSHLISPADGSQRFDIYHKNHNLQTFTSPNTPAMEQPTNPLLQPKNRFGVIVNGQIDDVHLQNLAATTPTSLTGKQGSPFYAEPADSLGTNAAATTTASAIVNIKKRPQKNISIPNSQRFSEPPKGPIIFLRNGNAATNGNRSTALKGHLSGSLDELKKQNRKARGRLDPWPLDSSWEFMGNEGDADCDSDLNWKGSKTNGICAVGSNKKNVNGNGAQRRADGREAEPKQPLTVHQIIAKKLQDLNLPELPRCLTPNMQAEEDQEAAAAAADQRESGTLRRGQRISAYDNVERGQIQTNSYGYARTGSYMLPETSVSDDGTVFSEPWDNSQWDALLNQDDTSESVHFSKCRAACSSADDDTIAEDSVVVLRDNKAAEKMPALVASAQPKVATIFRSRSCRDREILCKYKRIYLLWNPSFIHAMMTVCRSLACDRHVLARIFDIIVRS